MKATRIIPNLYYAVSLSYFLRRIEDKWNFIRNIPNLLSGKTIIKITLDNKWHFYIRDLYDLQALKEVFDERVYHMLFSNLKENTAFIDIGSYIGDTVIYAQQYKNINKIIALEPMPENMKFTKQNILLNKVKSVTLLPYAISTQNSIKDFFIHQNKGQSGFIKHSPKIKKIKVKTIALSSILKKIKSKNVIIKSDCEGAEYDLLMDLNDKYYSKIGKIIFEYHDAIKLPQILNKLNSLGYKTSFKKHPIESNLGVAFAERL